MDDPVLPSAFLMMCSDSYIGEKGDPDEDYFICPGLTPDWILA